MFKCSSFILSRTHFVHCYETYFGQSNNVLTQRMQIAAAATDLCVKGHEPVHSVQQHPPKKDYVRAVSLLTGYLIQSNGPSSCTLYYLTQVDPQR